MYLGGVLIEAKDLINGVYVDAVSPRLIEGWAQSVDHPEAPVCLDIYAGGELIGQTLANRYREDLEAAGLGSGRHSFSFAVPDGLMLLPGTVEVRRSLDGTALKFSTDALRERPPSTSRTLHRCRIKASADRSPSVRVESHRHDADLR